MPEHQRPQYNQYLKSSQEQRTPSDSDEDDDIDEGAQSNQKNVPFIANINVVQDLSVSPSRSKFIENTPEEEKTSKMYKDLYHKLMKSQNPKDSPHRISTYKPN